MQKKARLKSRQVGVRELKNGLSAYLREVKAGATLVVTEHDAAIAEICPAKSAGEAAHPILEAWVAEGVVRLPLRPKVRLARSPIALPNGTAQRLLDEDRGEDG